MTKCLSSGAVKPKTPHACTHCLDGPKVTPLLDVFYGSSFINLTRVPIFLTEIDFMKSQEDNRHMDVLYSGWRVRDRGTALYARGSNRRAMPRVLMRRMSSSLANCVSTARVHASSAGTSSAATDTPSAKRVPDIRRTPAQTPQPPCAAPSTCLCAAMPFWPPNP